MPLWSLLVFSPLSLEKCLRRQCNYIWRYYVFCGQRASSGEAICFLCFLSVFFEEFFGVKQSNHPQLLLFEQLLRRSEYYWTVQGCLLSPTCSSWIWKSLWTQTQTFGWFAGSAGTSQSAGETSKASSSSTTSLWSRPSSSTSSRPWGWLILLCREVKLSHHTFVLLFNMQTNNFSKCTHLFCSFVPRRWWEHGGHWSDSPACSQPAGGGEWPQHWLYIWGWRHHVSESCNILTEGENKELQADMKSEFLSHKHSGFYCSHHILFMVHIVVQKLSPTRHYGWRSNLNCFRLYWSFDVVYLSACLNRP